MFTSIFMGYPVKCYLFQLVHFHFVEQSSSLEVFDGVSGDIEHGADGLSGLDGHGNSWMNSLKHT